MEIETDFFCSCKECMERRSGVLVLETNPLMHRVYTDEEKERYRELREKMKGFKFNFTLTERGKEHS